MLRPSWVVLLLADLGSRRLLKPSDSLTEARWSKIASVTCLVVVAGCQLSHFSPAREPELIYLGEAAFQENESRSFKANRWKSHNISSPLFYWSEQVTGQPRSRDGETVNTFRGGLLQLPYLIYHAKKNSSLTHRNYGVLLWWQYYNRAEKFLFPRDIVAVSPGFASVDSINHRSKQYFPEVGNLWC